MNNCGVTTPTREHRQTAQRDTLPPLRPERNLLFVKYNQDLKCQSNWDNLGRGPWPSYWFSSSFFWDLTIYCFILYVWYGHVKSSNLANAWDQSGFQIQVRCYVHTEHVRDPGKFSTIPPTLPWRAADAQADSSGDRICLACFRSPALHSRCSTVPQVPRTPVWLGSFQRLLGLSYGVEFVSQLCCKSGTALNDFQGKRSVEAEEALPKKPSKPEGGGIL